jgi:hypothetical protein
MANKRQKSPGIDPVGLSCGGVAHALRHDGKTVLGPWVKFASADTLGAPRYLGCRGEVEAHWHAMRRTGQGSGHIQLLPNRKNFLRIDWDNL